MPEASGALHLVFHSRWSRNDPLLAMEKQHNLTYCPCKIITEEYVKARRSTTFPLRFFVNFNIRQYAYETKEKHSRNLCQNLMELCTWVFAVDGPETIRCLQ
uniref:Uncharacterized protein n=1 Tax=Steinernema glaseri TaxID=37863 RepID=A0A1I8A3C1_9BILA